MSLQTRLEALVAAIGADIKTLRTTGFAATVTQEDWHLVGAAGEPAFLNGWVNYDAVAQIRAAFKKTPDGRVVLGGLIKNGTTGPIFTLPVGYRPTMPGAVGSLRYAATASTAATAPRPFIGVDSAGLVQAYNVADGTAWVDLSGVEFDIGQTTFPAGKSVIPTVTALPAGPTDGQEVYFQTAAMKVDGVKWHLQYDALAPGLYKWIYLGGAKLVSEILTSETSASVSYANLATTGPFIALPLAGDYDIAVGAVTANNSAGVSTLMSYAIGAAAAVDADRVIHQEPSAGANNYEQCYRMRRKTGLAAATLVAKYSTGGAGTGTWANRFMVAVPVRVG